jgi:hypothetical protein
MASKIAYQTMISIDGKAWEKYDSFRYDDPIVLSSWYPDIFEEIALDVATHMAAYSKTNPPPSHIRGWGYVKVIDQTSSKRTSKTYRMESYFGSPSIVRVNLKTLEHSGEAP